MTVYLYWMITFYVGIMDEQSMSDFSEETSNQVEGPSQPNEMEAQSELVGSALVDVTRTTS